MLPEQDLEHDHAAMTTLTPNTADEFPHLSRTPIVEAVLEIRCRAENWDQERVTEALRPLLSDYGDQRPRTAYESVAGSSEASARLGKNHGWFGVEARTGDGRQIALFGRDRFVYSRLAPYPGWESFLAEGMRLWDHHRQIGTPGVLQRIGIRNISTLTMDPARDSLSDYLRVPPAVPGGLAVPVDEFLHREVLRAPGFEYSVVVTRALKPGNELIVDIDVFTEGEMDPDLESLSRRLAHMRTLKNTAYFGTITDELVERLK